jgi:hypothetical protein
MAPLDLDALRRALLTRDSFASTIVADWVKPAHTTAVRGTLSPTVLSPIIYPGFAARCELPPHRFSIGVRHTFDPTSTA